MMNVIEYLSQKSNEELCGYYAELFYGGKDNISEDAEVRKLVRAINEGIERGEIQSNGLSGIVYVGTIWPELCHVMADRFYKSKISR